MKPDPLALYELLRTNVPEVQLSTLQRLKPTAKTLAAVMEKLQADACALARTDALLRTFRKFPEAPAFPIRQLNDIGEFVGSCVAKRALEVAAVGGHRAMLYGPAHTGKKTLAALAGPHVRAYDVCLCGDEGTARGCICPRAKLNRWKMRLRRIAASVDMVVEVAPVPYREMRSTYRELDEFREQRIQVARDFVSTPGRTLGMDAAGERTMELAARRLSFSKAEYDAVLRVARSISDLNGSKLIEARAIAEAAQYRSPQFLVSD